MFFLISGYVMCRYVKVIYEGKVSLKLWTAKRTLRCIPMMTIAAVAFEISLYIHSHKYGLDWFGFKPTVWGTVVASLGVQSNGFFENPCLNNPTWYISVLFLCYVVFYLLTVLARKWRISPAYFYAAMVLLGCGIATYGVNWLFLEGQMARGYRGFFFGLLLAMTIEKQGGTPSRGLILASIAALTGFVLALIFDRTVLEYYIQYNLTFLVFPALIVLLETPVARKLFSWKLWGEFGKVSFGVYIWHSITLLQMNTLLYAMGWTIDYSRPEYMLIFTAVTEGVGVFSYYCMEKPIARRVNRKIARMENEEAMDSSDSKALGG